MNCKTNASAPSGGQIAAGYDVEVTDNADGTESYNIVTSGAGKPISVASIEGLDVPSNYGKVYLYDNKLYYVHA